MAVYFRDITENKRVAEELRESERRFSGMLANLDLVVGDAGQGRPDHLLQRLPAHA